MRATADLPPRTRWEASLRPLFVKTVWQDGRRHAILTRDDPLVLAAGRPSSAANKVRQNSAKRQTSISSRKSSAVAEWRRSSTAADLEECLRRLRVALGPESVDEEESEPEEPQRTARPHHAAPLSAPHPGRRRGRRQRDGGSAAGRFSAIVRRVPSPPPPQAAQLLVPAETLLPEANPLSERVLQWLDLEVRREKKMKEVDEECGGPRSGGKAPKRTAQERRASWKMSRKCGSGCESSSRDAAPLCLPSVAVKAFAALPRLTQPDSGVESGESSRGDSPQPPAADSEGEGWTGGDAGSYTSTRRELHIFVPIQTEKETPRVWDDAMSDCGSSVGDD